MIRNNFGTQSQDGANGRIFPLWALIMSLGYILIIAFFFFAENVLESGTLADLFGLPALLIIAGIRVVELVLDTLAIKKAGYGNPPVWSYIVGFIFPSVYLFARAGKTNGKKVYAILRILGFLVLLAVFFYLETRPVY